MFLAMPAARAAGLIGTLLWLGIGIANSQSSCWVLTGMEGPAFYKDEGFKATTDRFSSPITLLLNGENSAASGDDMKLIQVDTHMAVAYGKTETFTTNETYLIDPDSGTAVYTKSTIARGAMAGLTGARMFTGKARRCK